MSMVWDRSVQTGSDLLMLLALADYSDDEGNSYPSVAALARKCRMKPRNANYILSALQASGELRVLKNEGPRGTNRFRIMLDRLGAQSPLQASAPLQAVAPMQSAAPLQRIAPLQPSAPTPAKDCAKPLHCIAAEPSLNRQEPSTPQPPKGLVRFAEFWSAWPKNERKGGKAKCEEAWAKRGFDSEADAIVAHVKAMADTEGWRKEAGRYVPAPLVYLNGRRWDGADLGQVARESIFEGAI